MNLFSRLFLIFIATLGTPVATYAAGVIEARDRLGKLDLSVEKLEWSRFEGAVVDRLKITGLERTRESTVLRMINTLPTVSFNAEVFAADIQRLYNTRNLYNIHGKVKSVEDVGSAGSAQAPSQHIEVEISLADKWTLYPVLGAQGGGGSSTVGGGLYESNLLGLLINASIFVWDFNGASSYNLRLNQEYFYGSQTMWSLDWQDIIDPQVLKFTNGTNAGSFAWRRQQKQVMIGTHFPDADMRVLIFASLFQDSVFKNDGGFNVNTAPSLQQKIYPKIFFSRVNWSDYLESGSQFTVQPTLANFIGNAPEYFSLDLNFKTVFILGERRRNNLALNFTAMTTGNGGPDYVYNVGGYKNVRGFSDMREFGRAAFVTNVEFRPYLFSVPLPFIEMDHVIVQGCVFSDFGSAWNDGSLTGEIAADSFRPLWSAGAGFRGNVVKIAGAIFRLDFAQTISPSEGYGISFGVGQFF